MYKVCFVDQEHGYVTFDCAICLEVMTGWWKGGKKTKYVQGVGATRRLVYHPRMPFVMVTAVVACTLCCHEDQDVLGLNSLTNPSLLFLVSVYEI